MGKSKKKRSKKARGSNLEMFNVPTLLLVVCHHCVCLLPITAPGLLLLLTAIAVTC